MTVSLVVHDCHRSRALELAFLNTILWYFLFVRTGCGRSSDYNRARPLSNSKFENLPFFLHDWRFSERFLLGKWHVFRLIPPKMPKICMSWYQKDLISVILAQIAWVLACLHYGFDTVKVWKSAIFWLKISEQFLLRKWHGFRLITPRNA